MDFCSSARQAAQLFGDAASRHFTGTGSPALKIFYLPGRNEGDARRGEGARRVLVGVFVITNTASL